MHLLLHTLGGNLGQNILYLGIYGLYTFIWDVLVLKGKQKRALWSLQCISKVWVPNIAPEK